MRWTSPEGEAYMERDWGSAFPRAWVWTQSNHFDEDHVCLTASIADIPLAGRLLRGFIVGFLFEGVFYQWATWNGSRLVRFAYDDQHAEFTVVNGKHILGSLERRTERDGSGVRTAGRGHDEDAGRRTERSRPGPPDRATRARRRPVVRGPWAQRRTRDQRRYGCCSGDTRGAHRPGASTPVGMRQE